MADPLVTTEPPAARPAGPDPATAAWPVSLDDVLAAEERIRPFLPPSPAYDHPLLDEALGRLVRAVVKHENFQPTGSFKVRNALSLLTALPARVRRRGVTAATRGNHGHALAWAARLVPAPVTLFVPRGNNPEKNAAMRACGAELREVGADYDEAVEAAAEHAERSGATLAHSTNDPRIVAGAGTLMLELLRQCGHLDAVVLAIGGGSQAAGALAVARGLAPRLDVIGVQAARADAIHRSWRAGRPRSTRTARTFADGIATRATYETTFGMLCDGLADLITVTEHEIAAACRLVLSTTHTLVEGAGATGVAGLVRLRSALAGKRVAVVLSGANVDRATLASIVAGRTPRLRA